VACVPLAAGTTKVNSPTWEDALRTRALSGPTVCPRESVWMSHTSRECATNTHVPSDQFKRSTTICIDVPEIPLDFDAVWHKGCKGTFCISYAK
jgi:hypothetical protein